jgi:hypothetical protein
MYVFTYNEGKREEKKGGRARIFSLWYKNIFTSPGTYGEP